MLELLDPGAESLHCSRLPEPMRVVDDAMEESHPQRAMPKPSAGPSRVTRMICKNVVHVGVNSSLSTAYRVMTTSAIDVTVQEGLLVVQAHLWYLMSSEKSVLNR